MREKIFNWLLTTVLLTTASIADAQQPKKASRIGFLIPISADDYSARTEAFRQGLRDLGYDVGKNVVIEYRYADGKVDRLPELAAELVRLKVDIMVVGGTSATSAAKQATSTIPIVVGSAGDLVGAGLVASLARPGGNVTGSTGIAPDLSGKRLELLREIVSKASPVALLFYPNPGSWDQVRATETAAQGLGVKLQSVEVRDPNEFQNAYATMGKRQASAVIIILTSFTNNHRKQLVNLAIKNRLPSVCEQSEWLLWDVSSHTARTGSICFGVPQSSLTRSSRAPSPPTFLSSNRRSLSW